jgi:hypothetical protein
MKQEKNAKAFFDMSNRLLVKDETGEERKSVLRHVEPLLVKDETGECFRVFRNSKVG